MTSLGTIRVLYDFTMCQSEVSLALSGFSLDQPEVSGAHSRAGRATSVTFVQFGRHTAESYYAEYQLVVFWGCGECDLSCEGGHIQKTYHIENQLVVFWRRGHYFAGSRPGLSELTLRPL